jgi:hypothetical protein
MILRKTTDAKHTVTLKPRLARLFWSERLADPAMKVTLAVETEWMPEGTKLKVSVHADAECKTEALFEGDMEVKQNCAWLDWEPSLPEDKPVPEAFYFKVVCEKPALEAISPALEVRPFDFSA